MTASLTVVVPMHNEAENVRPLVEEVDAVFRDRMPVEIVVVDDCSRDDTAAQVREVARRVTGVRLIRHPAQRGQSTAVHSGVQAARGEWVAILDGDLQNDPRDFLKLLAARDAEAGATPPVGMVIGNRVNRRDTVIRRISSRVANGIRQFFLHDATPDTGCGLKLVERALFLRLPYFDHMHRFMPALVQQCGYRVISVPVNHRARQAGVSKYGVLNRLWVGIVDLFGVAWLARRNRRVAWTEESLR